MEFLKAIEKNKDKLIKDLVKLLQIDTVGIEDFDNKAAPFGEEVRDALLYMLVLGEKEGFKTKNIDNVAGHIEYGEGEEIIGVLTHLDVVPPGDGWKFPPFSGHIEDGKIYARGALDDKGPAMASFYALKIIKDLGLKLNKKVRLIFGTDEESGMRGIERYLEVCEKSELGFSPDANFPLIYGEKGIMSIDIISKEVDKNLEALDAGDRYNLVPDKAVLKTKKALENEFNKYLEEENFQGKIDDDKLILYGESAHAMEPEKGVNALVNLAKFVSKFHDNKLIKFIDECLSDTRFKNIGLDFKDKEMGDLTLNVAFAKMSSEGGKVGLNLRYPIKDRKSTRLNSSHVRISYAVFCLKKKKEHINYNNISFE